MDLCVNVNHAPTIFAYINIEASANVFVYSLNVCISNEKKTVCDVNRRGPNFCCFYIYFNVQANQFSKN